MPFKRHYVFPFVFISIVVYANLYRPLLPIENETKMTLGYPTDSFLNFTELSFKYGYTSEQHRVVTEDGYILSAFRMRGRNCMRTRQPPVILMHGLLLSSDTWLDASPRSSLAYLLSDACYDVWVGNQRGNNYGRAHVTLDPDSRQFWEFSVDEIGLYDIPATVQYVLEKTGAEKVNYIGYSQGSGTFFIMCSERHTFCEKVNLFIGLAPATRQTHTRSVSFRALCALVDKFSTVLSSAGVYEIFSKGAFSQEFMAFFCQLNEFSNDICGCVIDSYIDSYHPGSITNKTTKVLFGHFPAGTSVQNFVRYHQSMTSRDFIKYDYGKARNVQLYGSDKPPSYNLSAVTVPVVILYGKNDFMVDIKDVKWLLRKLPNVLEAVEVGDPLWNHFDMIYSQHANELVFPKVNEYLLRYSSTSGAEYKF